MQRQLLRRCAAVAQGDKGMHPFAQHRAGFGDHRAFEHRWMCVQGVFDLDGVDLVTAAVDHVLLAVNHFHITLGVNRPDITGMPEATGEVGCRRRRVVPVVLHHHRPLDPDFAQAAVGNFAPIVVEDRDLGAGQRAAHGVAVGRSPTLRHQG